jgi:WD40 repeat protein
MDATPNSARDHFRVNRLWGAMCAEAEKSLSIASVSAFEDKAVEVSKLAFGRELCTPGRPFRLSGQIVVTPDSRRAISASRDGMLIVWDLDSGRELWAFKGHSSPISGITVTPDGRRVVRVNEKTLRVWDLDSGDLLATFSIRVLRARRPEDVVGIFGAKGLVRRLAIQQRGDSALAWRLTTPGPLWRKH